MDWLDWHTDYDRPDSSLAQRLRAVQTQIRAALDRAPAGPITALSVCAGQGRDLIEVLHDHPHGADVRARLVELDPRNTAFASTAAAGLDVEIVTGDASLTANYRGFAPADLVLMCGVFGNITEDDIERTVDTCRALTTRNGTVIWTRGRTAPDLLPQICSWFEDRDFERLWVSDPAVDYGVAAHRYRGEPLPLKDSSMFTFVGWDVLKAAGRSHG
ncbi:class I SAM-dependent methyltransferase [Kutzneria sp. NPDC052558]|uniref:class I SAM-dependent methyltransferase n=1 Tax=Kutzneria sp. NPDC052558 TaxID=3364121 RepID=UPI0037CBAAD4